MKGLQSLLPSGKVLVCLLAWLQAKGPALQSLSFCKADQKGLERLTHAPKSPYI